MQVPGEDRPNQRLVPDPLHKCARKRLSAGIPRCSADMLRPNAASLSPKRHMAYHDDWQAVLHSLLEPCGDLLRNSLESVVKHEKGHAVHLRDRNGHAVPDVLQPRDRRRLVLLDLFLVRAKPVLMVADARKEVVCAEPPRRILKIRLAHEIHEVARMHNFQSGRPCVVDCFVKIVLA